MVMAPFDRVDQLHHAVGGDTGVLVLVSAGPDGHVEAVEVRLAVDGDPVVDHLAELSADVDAAGGPWTPDE